MSDGDTIQKVKQGDINAFGDLVRVYQGSMRAFTARYIPCAADAQDIVQEAFVQAFAHIESFDPARDFGPWMRGICKHKICNYYRARSRRDKLSVSLVDQALIETIQDDSSCVSEPDPRLDSLNRCLSKLKDTHRTIMEWRYSRRESIEKIAQRVSRSAASVAQLLFRLREAVRACVLKEIQKGTA